MSRKRKLKENNSGFLKVLLRLVVPVIIILVVGFLTYSFTRLIILKNTNVVGDSERINLHKYEGLNKSVFVFRNKQKIEAVFIIVMNVESGDVVEYYIPGDVYIEDYSDSLEDYVKIKELIYAGDALEEGAGLEYTLWEIQNMVAFRFDSYFIVDVNSEMNPANFKQLLNDYSKFSVFLYPKQNVERYKGIKSNKSTWNSFLLFRKYYNKLAYDPGEVSLIDVSEQGFTDNMVLESGKTGNKVILKKMDEVLRDNIKSTRNEELQREQVKVEVYNGSDIPGVAGVYSRMIENSGCEVVRYGNAPNGYIKTEIFISDKNRFDDSYKIVKDLFIQDFSETRQRPKFITTGDIVVILGKDLLQEMSWEL